MSELEKAHKKINQLEGEVQQLNLLVKQYESQLRLNKAKQFGKSRESIDDNQLNFLNEVEAEADKKLDEPTVETVTYQRRKPKRTQATLIEDLPIETVEYTLPEAEQTCPECEHPLHVIGKRTYRELVVIPAKVKVKEHIQYRYGCRQCAAQATRVPIIVAPMPEPPIKGSLASPSLLSEIIYQKYANSLPLYRQEQAFKQLGLDLRRATMANWVISASKHLRPLFDCLRQRLLSCEYVHADETVVQVIREQGRKAESHSYMWVYCSGRDEQPIILYEYQKTRSSSHPKNFLQGYNGYLQTDGYSGYNATPCQTRLYCLAHVRRKFHDAYLAMPKNARTKESITTKGLAYCKELYKIEQSLKEVSNDVRYQQRLEKSKPILDAFITWVDKQSNAILPKSLEGKAITYAKNSLPYVANYLLDGQLEIDNNKIERSIRPFTVGRRNWLFMYTPKGAEASALIYSIVETAKANNLNIRNYFDFLFTRLPNLALDDPEAMEEILPWSEALPSYCHQNMANK